MQNSKNNKTSGRLCASGHFSSISVNILWMSSLRIRRSSKSTRISDKNFDNLSNFRNDKKFLTGQIRKHLPLFEQIFQNGF